jgi:hypothetical protein
MKKVSIKPTKSKTSKVVKNPAKKSKNPSSIKPYKQQP